MLLIYEFASNEDPASLSKVLWKQGISHRILQSDHGNQLWLLDPKQSHGAMAILESWQHDPHADFMVHDTQTVSKPSRLLADWHMSPLTIALLAATFAVAVITGLGEYLENVGWFTISSFEVLGNRIRFYPLEEVLAQGEYWRLFTPALIHFGAAHLIFNALWVWDLGRKVERLIGSVAWLLFTLSVSVVSNVGQYLINGSPLFGGLSGLVYGLVGFAWLMPILVKGWPKIISKPLMVFFTAWLVLGYTDVFAMLGLGNMANEAHLIGLMSGLILAGVYSLYFKVFKRQG